MLELVAPFLFQVIEEFADLALNLQLAFFLFSLPARLEGRIMKYLGNQLGGIRLVEVAAQKNSLAVFFLILVPFLDCYSVVAAKNILGE